MLRFCWMRSPRFRLVHFNLVNILRELHTISELLSNQLLQICHDFKAHILRQFKMLEAAFDF